MKQYNNRYFGVRYIAMMVACLGMAVLRAGGAPVSAIQAGAVVASWLGNDRAPLDTAMGRAIKRVETFSDATGAALYYAVSLDPDGFVIVPADDRIEPIIAFASNGQYDPSEENPLGALVARDLPGRIQHVRQFADTQAEVAGKAAGEKWSLLRRMEHAAPDVEFGMPDVSDVRVPPLVQSRWDQLTIDGTACYNYYTPPHAAGSSANYYCGCVATAMAQLMRYHRHPVNGVGTSSFAIAVQGVAAMRSLRGGNGSGGAYLWDDMPLDPTQGVNNTQRRAIGSLTHDAGVSVNMAYGNAAYGGSGTDTLKAKDAFVTTFGYGNAIKGKNGGNSIGAGLNAMVNPNLDAGYPVLFGISDGSSGHAIVSDGYGYNLGTLYHHLNLGWAGADDAWYALPTITTGGGSFNSVYKCVYNVFVAGSGEIISGRVTDRSGSPLAHVTVTAVRSGGGTYSTNTNDRGIYAFPRVPANSTYTVSAIQAGIFFTNQVIVTGLSTDYSASSGNRWGVDFAATIAPVFPSNDQFAAAARLMLSAGTVSGHSGSATSEMGEPAHAGRGPYPSVWYQFTPATDGALSIDTHGSAFDTVLAIYTGSSVDSLASVASNDDDGLSGLNSGLVSVPLTEGTTYRIAVAGFNSASSGSMVLNWIFASQANHAPTNLTLSNTLIAENLPAGTTLGALTTFDPDVGNIFAYSLVGGAGSADNNAFTISGSALRASTSFNYEVKSSYGIRVRTTDQGGLGYEKALTIRVSDVDERPSIASPVLPTGNQLVLRWSSVTNHHYTILSSTNLRNGFSVLQSNIVARPPVNSYTASVQQCLQRFWMVTTSE